MDHFTGGARFERVRLPVAGGAAEQPAKMMDALLVLESVALDVLQERAKERERKAKKG